MSRQQVAEMREDMKKMPLQAVVEWLKAYDTLREMLPHETAVEITQYYSYRIGMDVVEKRKMQKQFDKWIPLIEK